MMNNQDYWRERMLYAKKQRLVSAAEYEDAMRSRLKDLEHEFEREAAKFTQRYIDENNTTLEQASKVLNGVNNHRWSMSLEEFEAKAKAGGYERILNTEYYRSRIYRLQQLHDQMAELAKKYSVNEEIRMRNELIKTYDDTYLQDNYVKDVLEGQLTVKLNRFNEQQLADIVYKPWNGSSFSERIWNNYTKVLPDVLTDTMLRATVMGYSANRVVKDIRDRFYDVSTNNIHRLVVTEMGHAAEEATAKFYEDSDIDQYQYLATLETHTCDQCRHLDDKIFNTKDRVEGKNYPLMHPYCRCTTVPYIEGLPEAPTRWARDSTTGKGTWIDNLKFSEWKKQLNIKPLDFLKPILITSRLTKDEERAVQQYISSDSYKINYSLRNDIPLTAEQKILVDNLDSALNKLPDYKSDKPLQRDYFFMNNEELKEFVKQMDAPDFKDKAYLSTSKIHYGEGTEHVHFIIDKFKTGKDISSYNETEQEVLFARNTKFIIKDAYLENNIITYVLEEQ